MGAALSSWVCIVYKSNNAASNKNEPADSPQYKSPSSISALEPDLDPHPDFKINVLSDEGMGVRLQHLNGFCLLSCYIIDDFKQQSQVLFF